MPEFDQGEYEERLRHALHRLPTPQADADSVLQRVEHGVRRRVRRRRIGTATLGVAAVMTAAAVVIPNLDDETTVADGPRRQDHESSKRLHQEHKRGSASAGVAPRKSIGTAKAAKRPGVGKTTKPSDLTVSDIAVNASGDVGLIGKSTCADGPCIVAGSPATEVDYRVAPADSKRLESMNLTTTETVGGTAPGIELGSDPANWWAWTDGLYATHDSGKTWKAVKLPGSLSITGVKSTNGRVWAFGVDTAGRSGVASADEHRDNWSKESVPVGKRERIETPMVVDGRVAFVASARDSARSAFVHRSSVGWKRNPAPCPNPVESTSADSTVWLGCTTPTDDQIVAWSHDDGKNWQMQLIEQPGLSAVGGVNGETAIAGVGADMVRVDAGRDSVNPVAAPYSRSDDVWGEEVGYTTIRFDSNGTGWATTTGGALGRSDDGGRTWQPASLP